MQLERYSLKWLQSSIGFSRFRNSYLASTTALLGMESIPGTTPGPISLRHSDDTFRVAGAFSWLTHQRSPAHRMSLKVVLAAPVPWEALESWHNYIGTWSFSVLPCRAQLPHTFLISVAICGWNGCLPVFTKRLVLYYPLVPSLVACGTASLFAGCAVLLMLAWHCLRCKVLLALRLGRPQRLGKRWSDTSFICGVVGQIEGFNYIAYFLEYTLNFEHEPFLVRHK